MTKLYAYPAVFYPDDGSISVYFPDLEGCLTFGDDFADAFAMAKDALGCWLSVYLEDNPLPKASAIEDVKLNEGEKVMLVEVDPLYLQEVLNKSVRRNITLPSWLDMAAQQANINVSAVTAEALKEKLNVT